MKNACATKIFTYPKLRLFKIDVKTKDDLNAIKKHRESKLIGTHKSQKGEKPCEVKVSRTVLKTSRVGDNLA